MSALAAIIALVLFVLAAFGVGKDWDAVEILPLGLAFLALAFILPGGIPTLVRTVRKD